MEKQATLGGPITFVTFVKNYDDELNSCLIYAHGSWIISTFPLGSSTNTIKKYKCSPFAVEDNRHKGSIVHGMKQSYSAAAANETTDLWIVYGNRKLSILSGGLTSNWLQHSIRVSEDSVAPYMVVSDWIWDARFLLVEQKQQSCYYKAAIGLANNIVEIWKFKRTTTEQNKDSFLPLRLFRLGEVKCITYCMKFYGWHHEEDGDIFPIGKNDNIFKTERTTSDSLMIASGTCFSEVIVWQVNTTMSEQADNLAKLIQRIQGHSGAVYSIAWQHHKTIKSDEWFLASTSDDRTVRVWKMNWDTKLFEQLWCGYGHTSRVWDVIFLRPPKDANSNTALTIASVGEEGIVRVWNITTTQTPTTATTNTALFRGHYDGLKMCLWKIASLTIGATSSLAVAGNDGGVKLYSYHHQQSLMPCATNDYDSSGTLQNGTTKIVVRVPSLSAGARMIPNRGDDIVSTPTVLQRKSVETERHHMPTAERKLSECTICSAQFYPTDRNRVLVSMKSGALWTLHLKTSSPPSDCWEVHSPWWSSSRSSNGNSVSFPHEANCMSIHPDGNIVAFGSTKGDIALVSIVPDHKEQPTVINAERRFTIQGLHWITNDTLITFHIKGVVSLWALVMIDKSPSIPSLQLSRIFDMKTSGVPTSCSFENESQLLFVGDSRGNIAMFDANKQIEPSSDGSDKAVVAIVYIEEAAGTLKNAHGKEHVTGMVVSSVNNGLHLRLISVGLDGCLTESNVVFDSHRNSYIIQKAFSRAISSLSSLSHVWVIDGRVIVGGFQGATFSLWDTTNGFELLSVKSGGRQRRHIVLLDEKSIINSKAVQYSLLAICASSSSETAKGSLQKQKIGSHEIHAYFMSYQDDNHTVGNSGASALISLETFKNLSMPFHGETVNDVCWVKTSDSERMLLLSGSKNGTVNLCVYNNCSFVAPAISMPPHESSVKAVCCSRHPGRKTSLLVTAGGKLLINFYRLEELDKAFGGCQPYSLHLLCCHKPKIKAAIDHRINAVTALPFIHQVASKSWHVVLAGDSNGCLHLFVVDELNFCRTITGQLICADNRPILCLDVVDSGFHHGLFAFAGNSTGEVCIWHISYEELVNNASQANPGEHHHSYEVFPAERLYTYQAHQMGTNTVSALAEEMDYKTMVTISSGGDDQALVLCTLQVSLLPDSSRNIKVVRLVKENQNESCLRSVKLMAGRNCYFLYAVGYEQRLTAWMYSKAGKLERVSQIGVDVFDVASMVCIENSEAKKSASLTFAVSGEGVQTLSLNLTIFEASLALLRANYLLIFAGAGFSADSGLETYECMPELYRDFCKPFSLLQEEDAFQKYWLESAKTYANVLPHEGYHILDRWCAGLASSPSQDTTQKNNSSSPFWVYTSNVDGHFRRFNSLRQCLCEIHGYCNEFRCSSAMGLEKGIERQGSIWMIWNAKAMANMTAKCADEINGAVLLNKSDTGSENSSFFPGKPLQCVHCGLPMRPNVLMFHDTDDNVLRSIRRQCERYQAWEQLIEDDVVLNGKNLVILELGCGLNVPAARQESEEVLRDCINRIACRNSKNGNNEPTAEVTLIRVNPKDARIDNTIQGLSIYDTSLSALRQINHCMKSMKETLIYL